MFKTIREASEKVENNRTGREVFFSLVEEIGELSQEINVKYNKETYKKADVDGILGEACDTMICLVDLLIKEGYTEEQINETIKKKTNKWIEKTTKKKGGE